MDVLFYVNQLSNLIAPAAVLPSLVVALLFYLLITRQLDTLGDDPAAEDFDTAGERNEWLGGPTCEYLGV